MTYHYAMVWILWRRGCCSLPRQLRFMNDFDGEMLKIKDDFYINFFFLCFLLSLTGLIQFYKLRDQFRIQSKQSPIMTQISIQGPRSFQKPKNFQKLTKHQGLTINTPHNPHLERKRSQALNSSPNSHWFIRTFVDLSIRRHMLGSRPGGPPDCYTGGDPLQAN